jgi:hypothetical protein
MGRNKIAVSEVNEELEERTQSARLNIRAEETKAIMQNRRTRTISEILTINNVEVRNIKYLGTVISNTNDGTEKVETIILSANKAYSSLKLYLDLNKSTKNKKDSTKQ